jgi:hypothetical protein
MSFSPIVPYAGFAGWSFLQRTGAEQRAAFVKSGEMARDADYFREHAPSLHSAEDLISDRRMLKVALGAFGLSDDINNKYFLKKILEDGTLTSGALANKLSDKRYLAFSKAFGFGDFAIPRTQLSDFADKMLAAYQTQSFETAVGEQSNELRLAMNADRELPGIADGTHSETGKWYQIMSSPPLRQVVQTAFGFPSSFVSLDIDQQLGAFKDAAQRYLGTEDAGDFSDDDIRENLVRLFLVRSEISGTGPNLSGQRAALTLLQARSSAGVSILL